MDRGDSCGIASVVAGAERLRSWCGGKREVCRPLGYPEAAVVSDIG
jgi:hypothetical protein